MIHKTYVGVTSHIRKVGSTDFKLRHTVHYTVQLVATLMTTQQVRTQHQDLQTVL